MKQFHLAFSFVLAALLLAGCSQGGSTGPGYFKTHFQNESQFIVERVLTDVAEMAFYAKNKALPDPDSFSVEATEMTSSHQDAPSYEVRIVLKKKQPALKVRLDVNGPIWSPEVYADAAGAIFDAVGLAKGGQARESDDGSILGDLTDCKATSIEAVNRSLSKELQADFRNPVLHEKAALLLGAFAGRENSGLFWDIRLPLCRMAAHLAMADTLAEKPARSISGQYAELFLYDGMGDSGAVEDRVEKIRTTNPALLAWTRIFKAGSTLDYRPLDEIKDPLPIEHFTSFSLHSYVVNNNAAWNALSEENLQLPDYCRSACARDHSVEIGHKLLALRLPLEFKEINEVFAAARGGKLNSQREMAKELNQMPERCFSVGKKGVEVKIIGWGQWAMFLQRHLCHAIREDFYFLQRMWGVSEEAKKFADEMESAFNGLRLYPFVRRFNCTDEAGYHKAVDDAFVVTRETPHLVSANIWNYLCYKVRFAPLYNPNPNPHINEWHSHNPLPGTVYDLSPRLDHPSLVSRGDFLAVLETLHQRAPCNLLVCEKLMEKKYQGKATYEQVVAIYGPTVEYANGPITVCAKAVENDPEKYEALMVKVCQTNPNRYFDLGQYFLKKDDKEKAAAYTEKGFELGQDAVSAANNVEWLIFHYLKKGNKPRAKELADFAGQVYSFRGLRGKAGYLEETADYEGAFEWYRKIEERYDDVTPLLDFYFRYKEKTGESRFDDAMKLLENKVFKKGKEKASLKKLEGAPSQGVEIAETSDLLTAAGLKQGDLIVALYGVRVSNVYQYIYLRDTTLSSKLVLIVWQGDRYREIQASPPGRKFGVRFADFPPQSSR